MSNQYSYKPKRHRDQALLNKYRDTRCEYCNVWPSEPTHIKSRGSGGGDYDYNVVALCRVCHVYQHQSGWINFALKRPQMLSILLNRGWRIENSKLIRDA